MFASFKPLVGGPPFFPLHVEIVHANVAYDFLPVSPLATATTTTLLRGSQVDGEIRCRSTTTSEGGRLIGYTTRTTEEMRAFAEQQPRELSLLNNNCWTFASSLVSFGIQDT